MTKNLCCENIKLILRLLFFFALMSPPSLLLGCYCFFANSSSTPHCLLQDRLSRGLSTTH